MADPIELYQEAALQADRFWSKGVFDWKKIVSREVELVLRSKEESIPCSLQIWLKVELKTKFKGRHSSERRIGAVQQILRGVDKLTLH